MKSQREIYEEILPQYLSDEYVSDIAFDIWIRDGRPNGERHIFEGRMKIKDFHWLKAKEVAKGLANADASTLYYIQVINNKE